jgi:1-acyl-sn-glycerol-3-phosphate acyltransferase
MLGAFMFFLIWFPLRVARRLWWRWEIIGAEHLPPRPQGVVLASNHIDWTDIHVLGASLPLSHRPWWLAKVELFKSSAAAWWFRQMQVIPVRRGKRDMAALEACEQALRAGAVLIIFPEGHRSPNAALQEAKSGTVRLAVRSGCPIQPVAIWGTEHGMRGAMLRKTIHVRFGEPYYPAVDGTHIPADKMAVLTEEVMLKIAELMPEQYWGHYQERVRERLSATPAEREPVATH